MATPKPLAAGARVVVRDEEWVVRSVKAEASGGQAVHVRGVSELVRDREAIFLTALDPIQVLAPEETELVADTSSRFVDTRLYLESLARRTPATDVAIHLGHHAAIDPADYQLQPAARALTLPRARFLMADGVGLGKTIEVGVLLTELIRRGRGRRILVVAMKSILAQFQEELWSRFTIPLVRLDSVGVQRVQSRIPSSMNPFHYFDRVIVSIDTLKNDRYRQHLERCRWDVIVVDECQNVAMRTRNRIGQASQRAQLAKLLANQCDSLILTSATPHDGSPESFASLMRMLEPTAIADETDFTHEEVAEFFQRKFKKDVAHQLAENFPERELQSVSIDASGPENAFMRRLREVRFATIDARRGAGGVLFRTTLLKAFLSSPAACISTIDERLRHRQLDLEQLEGEALEAARIDRELLGELRELAEAVHGADYPKYAALLEYVRAVLAEDDGTARVVIFSERIQTLEFLRESLVSDCGLRWEPASARSKRDKSNQIATFYGSLDDQGQMELVKSFGSADSSIRVLLASDAASEGINLHFHCHNLIHYDLPWSLITLVQRNGRIDRYGQRRRPVIRTLLTVPGDPELRGDLRVLDRLIEKEEQVHKNLGDVTFLVGLHDDGPKADTDRALEHEHDVALAVQGEKSPEAVLPDDSALSADDGWFNEIFADADNGDLPLDKRPRVSLFETDLDFARQAFERTVQDHEQRLRWLEAERGFALDVPDDLAERYRFLPPELSRASELLNLTVDRSRVMASIDASRDEQDAWPEWELFWPLHPVCEWLDDRVLATLGRHRAWVVPIAGDLGGHDALFLFQGVYSNRRSQPVIVDWFAIPFRGSGAQSSIGFDEVLRLTGLVDAPRNPGAAEVPSGLLDLRRPAVGAAHEHMDQLRKQRSQSLGDALREGQRKLKAWRDKSLARIEQERVKGASAGRALPKPVRRRLNAEAAEVERTYMERGQWIERGLSTVRSPYLRLAAVFVRSNPT